MRNIWQTQNFDLSLQKHNTVNMATAIKAIPTLKGKEAREFLRQAEDAERNFKGFQNQDEHPFCMMAHTILSKAGML